MQIRRGWFTLAVTSLTLVLTLFSGDVAASDARPVILDHLSTLDGLPQGTIYSTLQDSRGFIWFGTEDGLVRYDGHQLHRYSYSPTVKNGLPGNFIFAIAEDKNADLWIATKGAGLARWNRATDTFTSYRHDKLNDQSIASDFVRTMIVDSQNRIWIGTMDSGVDVLDPPSGSVRHLRHEPPPAVSLIDDNIFTLNEDRRGEIWIGTRAGIDRWKLDGMGFKRSSYLEHGQTILPASQVMKITEDDDGTLWAGTFDTGLFHLDYSGTTIRNYRHIPGVEGSISNDEVHSVLNDHAGHLWIGTAQGLDLLTRGSNLVDHYVHDKTDPGSLSDSFIMSLYEDKSGLLWIGTRIAGVNRWNSHSWELGGASPGWLNGKSVTSFADAPFNHLWIGTLGGGLFNADLRTGGATNLDTILHVDNALGDGRVMILRQDRRGVLWIGTMQAGLKQFLPNGKLISIPVLAGDAHGTSAAGIAAIYEARNGLVWIGTHGGGANVIDPATGFVRQLPFTPTVSGSTSSANITSFTEDSVGNIWIGTEEAGLDIATADGTVVQVYRHDDADPNSLSADTIYSLEADAKGSIWIATGGGGLDRVVGSPTHLASLRFQNFSQNEGLSSSTIYGIVHDRAGHLWLSGNAGLMRFDPSTHAVKSYHHEQGLQGEEFNFGAYHRTESGRVCFGGTNGFNVFDPSILSEQSTPPRISLTGLEVLGIPVRQAAPLWVLQDMSLNYRDNVVSFDFAALDFTSLQHNRLAYRVTGLTDRWIDLNSQGRVTLTNLDAGDHVLEVRAASADSGWSEVPYRVRIHKSAAPWASTAAYSLYFGSFIALLLWSVHAQRRKLQRVLQTKQQLEGEVALRTKELRESNQKLVMASAAKNEFLSRMGHELRTPMNGVVGMAELLARAPLPSAQARQVQTIRSSARTLLQILNDLLDLSKAQAGKIQLEKLPIDLNQMMEESLAIFSGAAQTKGLDLILSPALCQQYELQGDPLRMRQIVMNLVGNAIKFTEKGEVVVTCDTDLIDEETMNVRIVVADTGIGISETAIDKVFEAFTQADETTSRRFGGTGLGLSICRQLVELMGGRITVDSRPHAGSTFTVQVPLKAARQVMPVSLTNAPKQTFLICTRRRALAESLQRHAKLLGSDSRLADYAVDLATQASQILVVDADSFPEAANVVCRCPEPLRYLIVATEKAIETQRLESTIDVVRLIRSPIQRDAIRAGVLLGNVAPAASRLLPLPGTSTVAAAHVLVVEDDLVNGTVAEGYLKALGCSSIWVKEGASAIARNSSEKFDLILMDLNMPGLDGYETTKHIRAGESPGCRIPIVALTANNAENYRDGCLAAGMDDILTKPYSIAECAAMLRRWVAQEHPSENLRRVCHNDASGLAAVDTASVAGLRKMEGPATNLYARLVAIFEKNSIEALSQIRTAFEGSDMVSVRATAHRFKGAAGNVGALAFAAQLGEMEQAAGADDSARAQAIFRSLLAAHPDLMKELNDLRIPETA